MNVLGDEDWIIHLDEETLLTDGSIRDTDVIANFVRRLVQYTTQYTICSFHIYVVLNTTHIELDDV